MLLRILFVAIALSSSHLSAQPLSSYPVAKQESTTIEKHGVRIEDPYAWMENDHDPELHAWVQAQNSYTDNFLNSILRQQIYQEFAELYPKWPQMLSEGEANSIYMRDEDDFLRGNKRLFQKQRPGVSLSHPVKSETGNLEIQFTSETGSDLSTIRVFDKQQNLYRSDLLFVKYADARWEEGEESFLYSADRDSRLRDVRPLIRRHRLGTRQNEDEIIWEAPDATTEASFVDALPDGRMLIAIYNHETTKWYFLDTKTKALTLAWQSSSERGSAVVGLSEWMMYLQTFDGADKGQIVRVNLETKAVETVVAETNLVIDQATAHNNKLYISYLDNDILGTLIEVDEETLATRKIDLPGPGSIRAFGTNDEEELTITFAHITDGTSTLKLDASGTLQVVTPAPAPAVKLETRIIYYDAHDGTKVPIRLLYQAGLALDTQTPMFMYGYGGFGINVLPAISKAYTPWLKRGGVVALVTLPGGLERGLRWRQAGANFNKHNVFNDFGAAGKALIDAGLTSRDKLVINGGSNGGLLVGATLNFFPDRFRAGVAEVGVLDLVNFQKFTGGKWWMPDYGDREVKSHFLKQYSLSPFHNLKKTAYPATLVITADQDDRVVPSHSYKYAARLQEYQSGAAPVLLHTSIGASHGFIGTRDELLRYQSNKWTFLMRAVGMQ